MQYGFMICYVTLACWLCYHRHIARLRVLVTKTLLSYLGLSLYFSIVDWLEDGCPYSSSSILSLCRCRSLHTYVVTSDHCLTLSCNRCLCSISLIPVIWLPSVMSQCYGVSRYYKLCFHNLCFLYTLKKKSQGILDSRMSGTCQPVLMQKPFI